MKIPATTRLFAALTVLALSGFAIPAHAAVPEGCTLTDAKASAGFAGAQQPANTWKATCAPMATPRENHTVTELGNGQALVSGGSYRVVGCLGHIPYGHAVGTAEVYVESTGLYATTIGMLNVAREYHTATRLGDGKVLLVGGSADPCGQADPSATSEIYHPVEQSFEAGPSLHQPRYGGHTATLLNDASVLIIGGSTCPPATDCVPTATAELYAGGSFVGVGSMSTPRTRHAATLLRDGRVLISGGWTGSAETDSLEIYDPITRSFSSAGRMTAARMDHAAVLLDSGKVLIAGGSQSTAEIYDPSLQASAATGNLAANFSGEAWRVGGGKVVLVDGYGAQSYNPSTGQFTLMAGANPLGGTDYVFFGSGTLLKNGSILWNGGFNPCCFTGSTSSASYTYQP